MFYFIPRIFSIIKKMIPITGVHMDYNRIIFHSYVLVFNRVQSLCNLRIEANLELIF